MKFTKVFSFLLAGALILGLPSCSSDDPAEDPKIENPGEKEDPEEPENPEKPEEPEEPEDPEKPEEGIDKNDPDYLAHGKELVLGDETYVIDEFEKETLEEGIDRMSLVINHNEKPRFFLRAHILRMDKELLKKGYSFEALMGGKTLNDYATPLDIAKRESAAGRNPIVTMNADYFHMSAGGPILGHMVHKNRIIKINRYDWRGVYGMTTDKELFIDKLTFDLKADAHQITDINVARGTNDLILYSREYGDKTNCNQYGAELLLKPVDGDWEELSDYSKVVCEVIEGPTTVDGGIAIPQGHIVLSGNEKSADICNSYKKGDKITLTAVAKGDSGKEYKVETAVGTPDLVLKDGQPLDPTDEVGGAFAREPRTAIGHSDKHLFMVAIEGRSRKSYGLSAKEIGILLQSFGATDAVRLDGGGSTLMVTGNDFKTFGQGNDNPWFRPVANVVAIMKNK